MPTLFDDLVHLLQDKHPRSLLLLRHSPKSDAQLKRLVNQLNPTPELTLTDPLAWLHRPQSERRRHQLGLLYSASVSLPDIDYCHLLARLRDLDCEAVYVRRSATQDDTQRQSQQMRSLGFLPLKSYADGTSLFYFDIYDYKMLPDWLSSRFWANPEMWNKARW